MANKNKSDKILNIPDFNDAATKEIIREQQDRILVAAGKIPPDFILKNAGIVNVFTEEIEYGDIAVYRGKIAGIGNYAKWEQAESQKIIDCTGCFVCPGFIDGHIHIESSLLSPSEFAAAVVPHGTTSVITDPHEIVNVAGLSGLDYMLQNSADLPLDVFVMLPSCVPATSLDESGALIEAEDLAGYMGHNRVLGLAELMNFYGTAEAEESIVKKIILADIYNKCIDGHAPGLRDYGLNAYITAGVTSDHECSSAEEALEKIKRGQWIMIREGTAAKNMKALMPLFQKPYSNRCMLVTDDKHPGDLLKEGHVDYLIRKAVQYGADPITAIQMATLNAARYFGLKNTGAIAPGYKADLVILNNLGDMCVEAVYKDGKLTARQGTCIRTGTNQDKARDNYEVFHSFHVNELTPEDFKDSGTGSSMRVIQLVPGEILTKELILPYPGESLSNIKEDIYSDIIKLAVVERHHNTGHIGLGYLKGYGLRCGAVASSIAHDSHNIIIAGTNEDDMALAANCIIKNQGGIVVVSNGKVIGELILPIAGLMSEESAERVDSVLTSLKKEAGNLGVTTGIDPFMTLAFLSLPVIPEIRLTTRGLADVKNQKIVKTIY